MPRALDMVSTVRWPQFRCLRWSAGTRVLTCRVRWSADEGQTTLRRRSRGALVGTSDGQEARQASIG
jgi:hypothetical protein